jgi:hypothetical protein
MELKFCLDNSEQGLLLPSSNNSETTCWSTGGGRQCDTRDGPTGNSTNHLSLSLLAIPSISNLNLKKRDRLSYSTANPPAASRWLRRRCHGSLARSIATSLNIPNDSGTDDDPYNTPCYELPNRGN